MSSDPTESMWVFEAWTWLMANRKRLLIAGAVVAVAGSALAVMNRQREQRELLASTALLTLQMKRDSKPAAKDFLGIAEQYAGTAAAERAWMLGAAALFTEGQYHEARGRFQEYLDKHPQGLLRPAAMLGIAACHDAANEVEKAEAGYQQVISTFPNEPIATQARLALALLLESKDVARAFKLYEEVAREETSAFNSQGRRKVEELTRKHPELKPQTAAAAPAASIPSKLPK